MQQIILHFMLLLTMSLVVAGDLRGAAVPVTTTASNDVDVVVELNFTHQGTQSSSSSSKYGIPQCISEGRFADPDNCDQYYDCLSSHNGRFVAHQQSCFGHAFHPTLKACVPLRMVKGCVPSDRSILKKSLLPTDTKVQRMCNKAENDFLCIDCKTLAICIGGKPHLQPCDHGSVCSMKIKKSFNGGVCSPGEPVKCTCNGDDNLRQDVYNPSKFLSCDIKGSDPIINSCPGESIFIEQDGICSTEIETGCTESGKFVNLDDCTTYHTCIYTTGGWFQKELTCKNNTMFNEKSRQCEDPCGWYSDNFTCEEEGRFANPLNCMKYYICIAKPLISDSLICVEEECPEGYEWSQMVINCVPSVTDREKCLLTVKPKECIIPEEWCIAGPHNNNRMQFNSAAFYGSSSKRTNRLAHVWSPLDDLLAKNDEDNDMDDSFDELEDGYRRSVDVLGSMETNVENLELELQSTKQSLNNINSTFQTMEQSLCDNSKLDDVIQILGVMENKMHNLELKLNLTKHSLANVNSTLVTQLQTMEKNLDDNSKLDNIIKLLGHPKVPTCNGSFTPVGDSCLLLAMSENQTWVAASQYCQEPGSMEIKMHNLEQQLQSPNHSLANVNSTLAIKLQIVEQYLDDNSTLDNIIQLQGHPKVPTCNGSFTPVGDSCLLLALSENQTWVAASQYCQEPGSMEIKMHNLELQLQSPNHSLVNVNSLLAIKLQVMEQYLDDNSTLDNIIQLQGQSKVPTCNGSFTPVGDSCLLLAVSENLTWEAARQYCKKLGADLVVFKDVYQYAHILEHIREVNSEDNYTDVWIGGTDKAVESQWVWVTGEQMPPFWGSLQNYQVQPDGNRSENCAALHQPNQYYIHDYPCASNASKYAPLCQKIPA